jgi:hypothetical protein
LGRRSGWRRLHRANSLYGRGDFGAAAVVYEALVRADPSHAFAAFMLADCYERQARFPDALHWAEVAAAQMPDTLEALQSVARLAVACGDHEKATTYVVRTLSLPEVVTGMPHEKQSLTVMPGLGKSPAFMNVDIDAEGRTSVCSRL